MKPDYSERVVNISRFYYADERNPDGSPALSAIHGSAYARFYVNLADGASQGPKSPRSL